MGILFLGLLKSIMFLDPIEPNWFEVVLDDGKFFELSLIGGGGRTVTCSGCTTGCTPTKEKLTGSWFCDFACAACSKTETVTTKLLGVFGH